MGRRWSARNAKLPATGSKGRETRGTESAAESSDERGISPFSRESDGARITKSSLGRESVSAAHKGSKLPVVRASRYKTRPRNVEPCYSFDASRETKRRAEFLIAELEMFQCFVRSFSEIVELAPQRKFNYCKFLPTINIGSLWTESETCIEIKLEEVYNVMRNTQYLYALQKIIFHVFENMPLTELLLMNQSM